MVKERRGEQRGHAGHLTAWQLRCSQTAHTSPRTASEPLDASLPPRVTLMFGLQAGG